MELGVYIHIPFCRRKCDYCNFYSIPLEYFPPIEQESLIKKYVSRLLQEIADRSKGFNDYNVNTIYLGGGTPSFLDSSYINSILEEIQSNFRISDRKIEITIECNPEDYTLEKINEYRSMGINRVALGVQTTNKKLHEHIGRSSGICGDSILTDFFSIDDIVHCIDLIIGIPGQTEADLSWELNHICDYSPEHISVYLLSIEAGTNLYNRVTISPDLNEHQRILFEAAIGVLKERGYIHYEVSNFALPSFESKHNLKYWKFLPYIGFGAGAHSFYKRDRFYNPSSIDEYIINDGLCGVKDERTDNAEIAEYIMTGMRLLEGISLRDYESKLNACMPEELMNTLREMAESGYVAMEDSLDDTRIKFTREGFFIMDNLIYKMIEQFI